MRHLMKSLPKRLQTITDDVGNHLVRGDVNPMGLFQGQNQIIGGVNLNIYVCQFP
jgi:hypothetical protein